MFTLLTVSLLVQILIHIGALTDYSGFKFAESAGKGGPLGELVQWSDLIAVLYILGHELTFSTEHRQLSGIVKDSSNCPATPNVHGTGLNAFDLVFLDITGVKEMKSLKVAFGTFRYTNYRGTFLGTGTTCILHVVTASLVPRLSVPSENLVSNLT